MQYFNTMRTWPFGVKLRFCWQLMFGMGKKKKMLSKKQVLKARRPVTERPKLITRSPAVGMPDKR